MKIDWKTLARDFEPDGALRDLYVSPSTEADWQQALDFIRLHSDEPSYSLDSCSVPLPLEVSAAFAARTPAASRWKAFGITGTARSAR